ncbi:MAG: UDP-N-acetylmuramyl-tripeptide synthetase, partial [Candidatus Paceibacterota bacterium]
MKEKILRQIEKIIPAKAYNFFQPAYHYLMSLLGAIIYRFPSRKLIVVGVTGTKGKSSTTEILNAILEEAGFKTALQNTVRFKIDQNSEDNKFKMSMPGRFFMQKFLRRAVKAGCQYAILEVTSQGAQFSRHRLINFDGLIVTNISPEHIEAHGSFEKYKDAKLSIGRALAKSKKKRRVLVVNGDDKELALFLALNIAEKIKFSVKDAEPYELHLHDTDITIDKTLITSHLSGLFNVYNMLAAITYAKSQSIGISVIKSALERFKGIRGRVENVKISDNQKFEVIVDYAHTADSLEKLYQVFQDSRKICVLGNTGGGRDKWKRPAMGKVADQYCDEIILTNEDPYDEDPRAIVEEVAKGIADGQYKIIMDRREAIREALKLAQTGDTVLITGKGTDPCICGPNGTKIPWDDATVAREEL